MVVRDEFGGAVARLESRWHRKHLDGPHVGEPWWWAPGSRAWWIGVLFAVGSALFALGAFPAYAAAVGPRPDAVTYFVGSIFFTAAGLLQYREAVDAGPAPTDGRRRRRWLVFEPRRVDWLACAVQSIGTFYFNWSTGNAVRVDLSSSAARQLVWRPDAVGSICFLVASGLCWVEVCHRSFAWLPGRVDWWIALVNLAGSVAFGVSAVAGFVVPSTGELRNAQLSNLGTFVGAVGFLLGAVLLLFERVAPPPPPRPAPA